MICHFYFMNEQLIYMGNFDLEEQYDNIWFIDTFGYGDYLPQVLSTYNLSMEYMGHMGIEMNEFDIYRIYKIGAGNEEKQDCIYYNSNVYDSSNYFSSACGDFSCRACLS